MHMSTCFVIVDLQQGTQEWRVWRHKGIGASDAPVIMGENPRKTAKALLEEKRGPARDYGQNEAMRLGTQLEPEARERYMAKTGRDVRAACLQSTRFDWLRASVDGLSVKGDAVVEIKCGNSAYRIASQSGSVPGYYVGQIQHILAVTGFGTMDCWFYWPGCPGLLLTVERDEAYIERLMDMEMKFWNSI